MTRSQFAHTIARAGFVLKRKDVLVIGSQAVHASIKKIFAEAQQSMETDIASLGDDSDDVADSIDGALGEASSFQERHGYYAQGVVPASAILPEGWRDRLVPFSSDETDGVTAHCLELHDLWLSKAFAGRDKDKPFCRALLRRHHVSREILKERMKLVHGQPPEKVAVVKMWLELE